MDFSKSGTKYFTLTALSKSRPFEAYKFLCDLKYDLVESSTEIEYFHASEDRQAVRDQVFSIIRAHLDQTRIDSLVVEKSKTHPSLQSEERFYAEMIGHLVPYVVKGYDLSSFNRVVVFTDNIPVQRKRKAVEKALKKVLAHKLPEGLAYNIFHHASKSNFDLQIVDYCNWAVYRKWERADLRSYEVIKEAVKSEFDIFRVGTQNFY